MLAIRRIDLSPTYHRLLAEIQAATIMPLTDVIEVQHLADAEGRPLSPRRVSLFHGKRFALFRCNCAESPR